MMKIRILLMAVAGALGVCPLGVAGTVTFTLDPLDGKLAGQAGTSVGWGYTITTDSDYITIQQIWFGDTTPIGSFWIPSVPNTVASAGSPIRVQWEQGISGLQYDIGRDFPVGSSTRGFMTLNYNTYSDPDLTYQIFGSGDTVNAQLDGADVTAEVDVNAAAAEVVAPEPGAISMVGFGALAILMRRRWRR